MGSEGTTSSSGGGDSSPANVVLTTTPMQAKDTRQNNLGFRV